MCTTMQIDWKALQERAIDATAKAYAPYSKFPVGAAALTDDGQIVTGCNVENVSYGLGVCAEVTLVGAMAIAGSQRLIAVAISDVDGRSLMPCGRCRQVLLEHGGSELLVGTSGDPRRLADLLPDAFGPDDLNAVVES